MFHGGERMACSPQNHTFRFLEGKVMRSPPSSPQSLQPNSHSDCSRVGMTQNALTEVASTPAAGSHLPCCLRALFCRAYSVCPCLVARFSSLHRCGESFRLRAKSHPSLFDRLYRRRLDRSCLGSRQETPEPTVRPTLRPWLDSPTPWLHAEKARRRAAPSFHPMPRAKFGLCLAKWMPDCPSHSWEGRAPMPVLPVPG